MPDPADVGKGSLSEPGGVLASDRERDQLVERLSAACADGRLDLAAFSDRLEAALAARTRADIARLEADLGQAPPPPAPATPGSGHSGLVGVMSSAVRKGRWVLQPSTRALALMGVCVLDQRQAEVASSHSHISAVAVMGSVRVIVPEGIDVDIDGIAVMGAKTLKLAPAGPLPGSPRIQVTALAVMGEVSVVSKPPKMGGDYGALGYLADRHQRHLARLERRLERHHRRRGGDPDDD